MTAKLTNDFKSNFALLLVVLNVNYNSSTILNFSKTLNSWTKAGLKTEGRIKERFDKDRNEYVYIDTEEDGELADIINAADKYYLEAIDKTGVPTSGHQEWIGKEIRTLCYKHDNLMFPLAVSQGLLDLKDVVGNAMEELRGVGDS